MHFPLDVEQLLKTNVHLLITLANGPIINYWSDIALQLFYSALQPIQRHPSWYSRVSKLFQAFRPRNKTKAHGGLEDYKEKFVTARVDRKIRSKWVKDGEWLAKLAIAGGQWFSINRKPGSASSTELSTGGLLCSKSLVFAREVSVYVVCARMFMHALGAVFWWLPFFLSSLSLICFCFAFNVCPLAFFSLHSSWWYASVSQRWFTFVFWLQGLAFHCSLPFIRMWHLPSSVLSIYGSQPSVGSASFSFFPLFSVSFLYFLHYFSQIRV